MGCGATILKKILIITFDDQYLKDISHIITNILFYQISKNGHGFIILQEHMAL